MHHHSIKLENKNHPQNCVSKEVWIAAWELGENPFPIPMLYFNN